MPSGMSQARTEFRQEEVRDLPAWEAGAPRGHASTGQFFIFQTAKKFGGLEADYVELYQVDLECGCRGSEEAMVRHQ